MKNETNCPKCHSENIYADGNLWICPECSNEWTAKVESATAEIVDDGSIKDSSGTLLTDGDTVSVLKELKIKGSTSAIKVGTKVKNIRLIDEVDGHNISCRIDGIGVIYLKSEFVRKA